MDAEDFVWKPGDFEVVRKSRESVAPERADQRRDEHGSDAKEDPVPAHPDQHRLDRQTTHTEAEAYLVLAQLSYRASVTRHSPPVLSKIRENYDGGNRLTDERAQEVLDWTDRRILQAAARRSQWR
ncbi:hypothetical protein AYO39_00570 [Actinobacteria bacterium SCGC AG-212-D09]|nr:hypothetical protein AYO39_00570 [Actinobacteria bacterium SCGC AG-212-D09]